MNAFVFLLAVLLSFGVFLQVKKTSRAQSLDTRPAVVTFSLLILFYFLNIIPPVPLSKKEMGIYRSVVRTEQVYHCSFKKPSWFQFLKKSERKYEYSRGDSVFCFTSIYAPTRLRKKVYHHWYFKNPETKKYTQTDKMGYRLTGGRQKGYRGYTYKKHIQTGRWKVMLKTDDKKTLGIIKFEVIPRDPSKQIKLKTIEY
jgi:hypothetical protein